MRCCTKCHTDKKESEYYSNGKGGLKSNCKECDIARVKARYVKRPDKALVCDYCEETFKGRSGKKYCSPRCRVDANNQRKHNKTCVGCGRQFVGYASSNYCTHQCYCQNADHSMKGNYTMSNECATCGDIYVAKSHLSMYCSDWCNPHKRSSSVVYFKNCKHCDAIYTTQYDTKEYCSKKCGWDTQTERVQRSYWESHEQLVCITCNERFQPEFKKSKKFCSHECRDKRARQVRRRHHSGKDHVYRAKRYGVYYETVDKFKVFNRDKYTCQCCGQKTPKRLALTNGNEDNEPTIDHIIPISKGGPHSYSNVQTLCRLCNTRKSNTTIGQVGIQFESAYPSPMVQ